MKPHTTSILLLSLATAPWLCGQAIDSGSREQLQQLTLQLQQSPADEALREKIIALALTANPRPAIPDDAIMAEGGAEYAFKNARAESDYSKAAQQYEKALILAPWSAADYFNCGVAHEKAGENKEAIRNFSLYLLAAPGAEDALAVKKRIGGLQYAQRAAIDEANSPKGQWEAFLKGLDGGVWRMETEYASQDSKPEYVSYDRSSPSGNLAAYGGSSFIEIHGNQINLYSFRMSGSSRNDVWKVTFGNREFSLDTRPGISDKIVISDDGKLITETRSGVQDGVRGSSRSTFRRIQ